MFVASAKNTFEPKVFIGCHLTSFVNQLLQN